MLKSFIIALTVILPTIVIGEQIDSSGRDLDYHENRYNRSHTLKTHMNKPYSDLRNRCGGRQKIIKSSYTKKWLAEKYIRKQIRDAEENIPQMLNQMRNNQWNAYPFRNYKPNDFKSNWGRGINCNKLNVRWQFRSVQYNFDEMYTDLLPTTDPDSPSAGRNGISNGGIIKEIFSALSAPRASEARSTGATWFLLHSFPFVAPTSL